MERVVHSGSPAETQRLGERLGRIVRPGDVITLAGDLGAGKTCFVQGLGRGLGVRPRAVNSPTFNIVIEHAGRIPLYHVDLYRIADAGELVELGMETYLYGPGVCAVEWMERFPGLTPAERLGLRIEMAGGTERRITVTGHGARGEELVRTWLAGDARLA